MSYCRFSSNNFMCDVYVYADCSGGWTTHIAKTKLIIPPIPEPPSSMIIVRNARFSGVGANLIYDRKIDKIIAKITSTLYVWLSRPHRWCLSIIPRKKIGLPFDGETFNHDTPGECAEWLKQLKELGYNVPQYAIDALNEEDKEMEEACQSIV